jgi:hypothetical protein
MIVYSATRQKSTGNVLSNEIEERILRSCRSRRRTALALFLLRGDQRFELSFALTRELS